MVVPYHQRPRFYVYEHHVIFQMVAEAPAPKSSFQTTRKRRGNKELYTTLLDFQEVPTVFHLTPDLAITFRHIAMLGYQRGWDR